MLSETRYQRVAREIEITPEMIEAGEDAILREVGGATDLGGHFSASALAVSVFRAMLHAQRGVNGIRDSRKVRKKIRKLPDGR